MTRRLRVAVLGGGRSSEHEVSLRSAASVADGLEAEGLEAVRITIAPDGTWAGPDGEPVVLAPGRGGPLDCDVVFPVLHGPYGEDGTVQGLLEMLDVPYVGSGVLGAALTMDKERCKAALRDAGIEVAREVVVGPDDPRGAVRARVEAELGLPVFVKPARLGSSVGISRVATPAELDPALDLALAHDDKVLVEELIDGREVECSVLGLAPDLATSLVGEITYDAAWYDYEAKYAAGGSALVVPARIPDGDAERLRATAARAFAVCDCHGMARIDFFHTAAGRLVLNEINAIPGFTATSYYARMFEASGLPYGALLSRLVELALARHARDAALRH